MKTENEKQNVLVRFLDVFLTKFVRFLKRFLYENQNVFLTFSTKGL